MNYRTRIVNCIEAARVPYNEKSGGRWNEWHWFNFATDEFKCGDRVLLQDVCSKCRELTDDQIVELIETEIAIDLLKNS